MSSHLPNFYTHSELQMTMLSNKVQPSSRPLLCLHLLILPCLCLLFSQAHALHHGDTPLRFQKMALLHWKSTLDSLPPMMSSWQDNTGPCNWTGIICMSMRHGRRPTSRVVTNISLPDAGIHGQLGELNFSALPFLTHIDLHNNSLYGPIPANVSASSSLQYLNLHHNHFSGNIPYEIGGLQSLRFLEVSFNNLTGPIPASLCNLTSLTRLVIHQTMVSGSIPNDIGRLVNLQQLQLSNSSLTGGKFNPAEFLVSVW